MEGIDRLAGRAALRLHHPQPREVALTHDAPWEGSGSGYHSLFRDGEKYRTYYKAWHLDVSGGKLTTSAHPLYCCTAESDDGITWTKPDLGLHEFRGSKANNITITSGKIGAANIDAGHPAVFKDDTPLNYKIMENMGDFKVAQHVKVDHPTSEQVQANKEKWGWTG